jgi:hypothetical protein
VLRISIRESLDVLIKSLSKGGIKLLTNLVTLVFDVIDNIDLAANSILLEYIWWGIN